MTLYNPSLSSSSASLPAAPPFDSRDADVVLRSSDNVDFRVHKSILKLASPVLAALISLTPLPPSAPRRHRRRRVVPLAEPGESLDLFLRFIYPVPEPPLSLDEVATLLRREGLDVAAHGGELRVRGLDPAGVGELVGRSGLLLHELTLVRSSLEDAFMTLTADSVEYAGASR